jgi:hypothetical protein
MNPAKKPRPPRGPRRAGAVLLALTVEERETLREAAKRDAMPLGVWARSLLLRTAREAAPGSPRRPRTRSTS